MNQLLRPHQVQPVADLVRILRAMPSAIDFSDTGTGKTYVACAVARTLNLSTLVVAPRISVTKWMETAQVFGDSVSAIGYEALRTGRSPFGWWDNEPPSDRPVRYRCTHCQCYVDRNTPPCYCHGSGVHCVETQTVPWRYGRFNFHRNVELVIFDEVHRAGALDSLNAEMLIAARRQGLKILALSATAAHSPLNLRALGYALDLFPLPSYYAWAASLGCRRIPGRGFKWLVSQDRQNEIMRGIRASLVPSRGVRVTTDSIPGFPARDILAECYDIEGDLEKIYEEMRVARGALAERAGGDKTPDSPLTRILRAQQDAELVKVPLAVELTRDYLAKGFSMGLFINYSQTLDELRKRFPDAAVIDGREKDRAGHLSRFQRNETRVILINNQAGGESLDAHDLDGNFPRGGLVFPCASAVRTRQLLGRFHRDGAKSNCFYRFLFAAGCKTDTRLRRNISLKLNNLDALNDADLDPCNLS